MTVEERRRITLRQQIAAALSEEAADTLFELIAPAGEQPATKQQVDLRFEQVDHRFELLVLRVDRQFAEVNQRIAELESRLDRRISEAITSQTRTLVISQAVLLVAIAALAFGLS